MSDERTGLDYAREILEMSLNALREIYTDPNYYAKVAPGVNGALANFLAAEAAELEDARHLDLQKVLAASRAYRDEMDPIGRFLAEECTIGAGNDVEASRLFYHYQGWCAECGEMEWSSTAFGKALGSKGFAKKRGKRGNSYVGINLNCDLEAATEGRPVMDESRVELR